MSAPKNPYPVEVHWVDPAADGGWKPKEELLKAATPTACKSVGYLMLKDAKRLVLVQNHNEREPEREDLWADSIVIPMSSVRKVRRLR